MDGLKESKQALGAEVIAGVQNFAPPTILAQASRLNFSTRLFNLIVTNIPGPQVPLYVLGRKLIDLFPIAFLPEHHGLAVAIMSYDGNMDYGLLGDYDALPDIDVIADRIDASLAELLVAARERSGPTAPAREPTTRSESSNGKSAGAPAQILPSGHGRAKHGPAADMRAKRARGSRPEHKRPQG